MVVFQVIVMAFLLTFIVKKDSDVIEYEAVLGKTKVDMETVSLNNQGTSTSWAAPVKLCM